MFERLAGNGRKTAGRLAAVALAVLAGCVAVAAGHAATDEIGLLKVRFGGDARETRLVIELDGATSAKLIADGGADRKVVLLLPGVTAPQDTKGSGRGVVKGWSVSVRRAEPGCSLTWRPTPQ